MHARARRGFTIVEALMAFLVLSLTLIVSFSVMGQVMKGTNLTEAHVRAATVAHGLLNQERAIDFGQVVPVSATIATNGTREGKTYTLTMLYSVDVESLDADTKRVTATVTWQEPTGTKTVTLQTVRVNL